ncbi:acetylxylan esterase [Puniceicoccaceae bacterium K14]|nr:acetylxylan esterase [Puniceicoccaceae bacterium K14]
MKNSYIRKITTSLVVAMCFLSPILQAKDWTKKELRDASSKIIALGELEAPLVRNEDGDPFEITPGEMRKIYFDALDYEGKSTRVFSLIQIPEGASVENKVPGIVLVHGGGGSAFNDWVTRWVDRGYAAISIAVEGQTNERDEKVSGKKAWKKHAWAGPHRTGIYADSSKPIEDQWMYHSVADTVLANSLMHSLPEVDASKIGIMGISWGGVITSTVIGIDDRFAFAIPTYGCGHKYDSENQYKKALGSNRLYKKVWDPIVRLENAKMPVQWLSWPGDKHFPMDALAASYRKASGPRLVTLIPGMKHGHGAGWRPDDSYAFADSIVRDGAIWSQQTKSELVGDRYSVKFKTTKAIDGAVLVWTSDTGFTGLRKWNQTPASLEQVSDKWVAAATLPESTTAWFVNLQSGNLIVSSDFEER